MSQSDEWEYKVEAARYSAATLDLTGAAFLPRTLRDRAPAGWQFVGAVRDGDASSGVLLSVLKRRREPRPVIES